MDAPDTEIKDFDKVEESVSDVSMQASASHIEV